MRRNAKRSAVLAAAACLVILAAACAGGKALDPVARVTVTTPAAGAGNFYYVSLGDSLSQGVQPTSTGSIRATDQGYTDYLYAHYHATLGSSLQLVKLGCSGETTSSMLTGTDSPCTYQKGSQLATALAFIKANRSRIALVTLDIGANDVIPCVSITAGSISTSCASKGLAQVRHDLPLILGALQKAVGSQTVLAGTTLYDPWLAAYLLGAKGITLATQSLTLMTLLNQQLTTDLKAYGFRTANAAGAFDTTDYTQTGTLPSGGTAPIDVVRICQWTWMCAASPVGPNVHARASGYQQIATVFEKAIGVLSKPAG